MSQMKPLPLPGTLAGLTPEILGRLMPMFLWLDRRGRIKALGPTLAKILGPTQVIGCIFARHFTLRRARQAHQSPALPGLEAGRRLTLSLVAYPEFSLRGTAVDLGPAGGADMLLNLSFGIHLTDAVRVFALTEADFAASDLAMELLYLNEAKAAVLGELRALTGRLDVAHRSAVSQALSDPLTGLANRRAFDAALDRALEMQGRGGRPFALAHLDLDFFKEVNDSLGHAAGDMVLSHTASVLQEEVRRGDLVARVGGDEFMLMLRGVTDHATIEALALRIIARLEAPLEFDGRMCRVSASIGIALSSDYTRPEADRMLVDADAALYHSKRTGRGRWTMYAG